MSLHTDLNLPDAVQFGEGDDGAHIMNIFGGTWCTDVMDEWGDYVEAVEIYGAADPQTEADLCRLCVKAGKEQEL